MKKLPIGIQTFKDIRDDNYVYVDKTKVALRLIESGKYYFLSRPRRFGKSLFLSTLKAIFESEKELFKDLYIYDKYNWSEKYPVIHISFAEGVLKTKEDILDKIDEILQENGKKFKIDCYNEIYNRKCFKKLITEIYEKYNQKVVILVDEYDKPILDNIEDIEVAKIMRDELKNIYSVIKGSDEYIKFAFLTGVSKFSKVSIFSGLNNIEDITLNSSYGDICGYTQDDLNTVFKNHLREANLEKVKKWYNGYNFLGESVYNPFDILLFISNNFMFRSYWFETGTPTFLIKLIEKNNYFLPQLSNLTVSEQLIDSFDIENINLEVVLFQSGYLTIDKIRETFRGGVEFDLKTPNIEVQTTLNDVIIDFLTNQRVEKFKTQSDIYKALLEANLHTFKKILLTLFASIPYNNYTNNKIYEYEGYYASVIYCYLSSLGLDIVAEDVTSRNRIDLSIKLDEKVYIIEFKVVDSKNDLNSALKQIKERNYAQKYMSKSEIYLIGIEFCKKDRNICNFDWERA